MALEQDIIDLFTPIIGGTVIWQDLNAPRPALPYTTLKLSSIRKVNEDHYSGVDDDGLQTVTGDREFTLNIQRYDSATTVCQFLQTVVDKLSLNTNLDKFMAKKLSAFDTQPIVDVSALLDNTKIEKRASVDIMMRYKSSLTDNVGVIETVEISADDDSDAPAYIIEATLVV